MTGLEIVGVSLVTYWAGCGVLSGAATLGRGLATATGLVAKRQYGQAGNALAGGLIAPALRVGADVAALGGDIVRAGRALAGTPPVLAATPDLAGCQPMPPANMTMRLRPQPTP